MSRIVTMLLLVVLAAPPLRGATAPPPLADAGQRRRFIAGAPGRLPEAGDRRHPRRWHRADSTVGAYADVDELADATWLRHEVEGYARRALACHPRTLDCARAVRRIGEDVVIYLANGPSAELVWTAGHHAVRLGWRRVVSTSTGTMTLDQPPADFLSARLAEWPSDLHPFDFDPARRQAWAEDEIDRRLDYADRALLAAAAGGASPAASARRFIRAALQALAGDVTGSDLAAAAGALGVPAELTAARTRIAAIRARRSAMRQCLPPDATPWCSLDQAAVPPAELVVRR